MSEGHLGVNISQKALIVIDNKLLLVLEDTGWELPGGRVDQEETNLIDALKRELREELSLEIKLGDIYSAYLFKKQNGEDILVLVYSCDLISSLDSIKIQEGEILDWKLFTKEELRTLNIYPNSTETIRKFLHN